MAEDVVWRLAIDAPGELAEWDVGSLGAPEPHDLFPARAPSSGDFSRHIPVTAHSVTTGSHLELESNLEHELLRVLERSNDVAWIVPQPLELHQVGEHQRHHVPDLLSEHVDGSVTIWDARPEERVDELFEIKASFTRAACAAVGWRYEIFHGTATLAGSLNHRWLHDDRRLRPWHTSRLPELRSLFANGPITIGEVMANDDGTGELTSTLWHYLWRGSVGCDLESPIRMATRLEWVVADG